jgi:hypothetical protein
MDNPNFDQNEMGDPILEQVHEGMRVVDPNDKEVGTVDTVYFGEVSQRDEQEGLGPAGISAGDHPDLDEDRVSFAFGGADPFRANPNDEGDRLIRDRLLREGFVKVDPGLFASDVFILPGQIASVSNDEVRLRVPKDDLIRR